MPSVTRGAALRAAFLLLVYVAASASVLNLFMTKWGFHGDDPRFSFDRLITHTADRPFAFRVLTPIAVRAISTVVEEPTRGVRTILRPRIERMKQRYGLRDGFEVEQLVAYFLMLASIVALLFVWRAVGRTSVPGPAVFHDLAPVIAVLLLPLTFVRGGFLYDFPDLLLTSAAVLCLVRRRWGIYLSLFVLAVLNKESNVVLLAAFAALAWPTMRRAPLIAYLAAQGMLGVSIVAWGRVAFAGNPGVDVKLHLLDNLGFFATPQTFLDFSDIYAPLVLTPRPFNLVSLILFGTLFTFRWSTKPADVRRMLVALLAIVAPLFLVFGFLDEVRVFYVAASLLYVCAVHTMMAVYSRDDAVGRDRPDSALPQVDPAPGRDSIRTTVR